MFENATLERDRRPNKALELLLRGVSKLFFGFGALSFFVGGRAISQFAKLDRVSAEMFGIGLAVVLVLLGFVAHSASERFESGEPDDIIDPK